MPERTYRVGVVGATGAVGSTILEVLAERRFPASEVVPLASARSAGTKVRFGSVELEVVKLDEDSVAGHDIVLSSAGGSVSSEWAPKFVDAGAVVVDNTSFWRMHDDVPLVVTEVKEGSVAAETGIEPGDRLTKIVADHKIVDLTDVDQFESIASKTDEVSVLVEDVRKKAPSDFFTLVKPKGDDKK